MTPTDRLAKLLNRDVDAWFPSPRALGYRARVDLNVDEGGRLCTVVPGTHDLVPLENEPLARDEVNRVIATLASHDLAALSRLAIRSNGSKVVLNGTARGKRGAARSALERSGFPAALDGKAVSGDPQLWLEHLGLRLRISPASFYQVNLEVNTALSTWVRDQVLGLSPARLLDLYAGIGNLSLPIAAEGVACTLIEVAGSSMRDARDTAKRHQLEVDARTSDAGRFRAGDAFFDVALLDPPRAGAPGVVDQLVVTRPAGLVYVSCNPSTMARDLRAAKAAGYRITALAAFEMFPGTPHLEAVATLTR